MQLHPGTEGRGSYSRADIKDIIENDNVIGMGKGWDKDRGQPNLFRDHIKVGDIILIRKDGPLALVEVTSHWYENTNRATWFEIVRKVKVLSTDGAEKKQLFSEQNEEKWNDGFFNLNTLQFANNSKFIRTWYMHEHQQHIINVLKQKKQVILQGPPGTGKTFTAKEIAQSLITPEVKGCLTDIFNDLLASFNPNSLEVKSRKVENDQLLSQFLNDFSKDKLVNLSAETYCIGRSDQDNFCWWLERGLKPLGYYFPGTSRSYLLFWSKKLNTYSQHGILKGVNEEQAFLILKTKLIDLVDNENIEDSSKVFGDSFILKILNTYYPEKYFPINSERMLDNALRILGKDSDSLNVFEKNIFLKKTYQEKTQQLNLSMTSYEFARLLYENFDLKKGSDISVDNEVIAKGEHKIVQFHPSYTYEDFVRGIVAVTVQGKVSYQVENKILIEFANKAQDNPNANYVLIIDEINRANLPSVLGELIYALEYRGEDVSSLYEYKENDDSIGERNISLPKNLYIIGTMNTADRSVGHIDYAIRRRFAFIDILPAINVISYEPAIRLFKQVQQLFGKDYLSSDFDCNDVQIGHSYFMVNDLEALEYKLKYEIKPILYEYIKDGVLLDSTRELIEQLCVSP
jgi:Cdc6-like AAA superfamily ATPase